jgi:phage shock protein PspC (stress-responsive transcriptional regulator)
MRDLLNNSKDKKMSDHLIGDAANGIFAAKALGLTGVAGVAAGVVAMAITLPKSTSEFFRRLLVTVLTSVLAGPIFIEVYGFDSYTLRSQVGICFLIGVPSWLIMSYIVHWLEKSKNKTPQEIADEIRKLRGR